MIKKVASSKVNQFEIILEIEDNVIRFDIKMCNSIRVQKGKNHYQLENIFFDENRTEGMDV
jgi:hypothetical protein